MKRKFKPKQRIGVGGIEFSKQERAYVMQTLNANRLSYGPFTQKFENLFSKLHECKYAIFCNSGTSALHIALAALKETYQWNDGDEVLVPAMTFIATSNIVLYNQMKPVFVDVDPLTYNINPDLISAKISKRTRAIIPVHLFGLPCDMDPILKIASQYNLKVIEDSCETMFAKYKGRKVGSFGDMGCFSTYIAHYIVTGVGGLVTTNDSELAIMLRSLINHGRDSIYLNIDDDKGVKKEELFRIVDKRFSFTRLGFSFRGTEMEAAIGLAQLERKNEIIRKRCENAKFYITQLQELSDQLQLPHIPQDREHVFMLFPLVLKREHKVGLVQYLEERLIETRDLMPLLCQPIYRKLFGDIERNYPEAQRLNQHGFYLGCHQYLKPEERQYVVDTIYDYFRLKKD
jgi:perosamine synthetase